MRFLHCADFHLGRRPAGPRSDFSEARFQDYFRVFEQLVDEAINRRLDLFLISGDLFDRKQLGPEVLAKTESILEKLSEASIPVLITEGNHDNVTPGQENDSWLSYLEERALLERISPGEDEEGNQIFPAKHIDRIRFYGLGYPGAFVDKSLADFREYLTNNADSNSKPVLLVHTGIGSSDFIPGTVSREIVESLQGSVLYVAGGHLHTKNSFPEKDPYFFIPGAPEFWDIGEKGERGAWLFDTANALAEFIPSRPRTVHQINLNCTAQSRKSFENFFLRETSPIEVTAHEDIIVIRIHMQHPLHVNLQWCEEQLADKQALKTIVQIRFSGDSNETSKHNSVDTRQIEESIIKQWPEPLGGHASAISERLQQLKEHQQTGNESLFFEEMDNLLTALLSEDTSDGENV